MIDKFWFFISFHSFIYLPKCGGLYVYIILELFGSIAHSDYTESDHFVWVIRSVSNQPNIFPILVFTFMLSVSVNDHRMRWVQLGRCRSSSSSFSSSSFFGAFSHYSKCIDYFQWWIFINKHLMLNTWQSMDTLES